tara:strand:- start:1568 stop:2470 length:903 start_codon:yes stop_codon:yes gene_type:complete
MTKEQTHSNPEAVEDAVFGSGGNFFENLENEVNSGVQDNEMPESQTEATPALQDPNNVEAQGQVSHPTQQDNQQVDNLKKRYSDSSREAQRLKAQLNELQPFIPVLDAMKKDSGLVEHVRGYFDNGGAVPQDVKKNLGLNEDFIFDADEMVSKPESDSRKVFNTMVDGIVSKRTNEILDSERNKAQQMNHKIAIKNQAEDFKQRYNMSDSEFKAFVANAQSRFTKGGLSFDDMYLLINRGQVNQNVANATKNDMLKQMKGVRDIPVSQGSANSQPEAVSHEDNVFDVLKGSDADLDNLFG